MQDYEATEQYKTPIGCWLFLFMGIFAVVVWLLTPDNGWSLKYPSVIVSLSMIGIALGVIYLIKKSNPGYKVCMDEEYPSHFN